MNLYIHIASDTKTAGLVAPLVEAIAASPLHKHIDGCIAQINAGYSSKENLFLKDADTILERAPHYCESEEQMELEYEGQTYTFPGFAKLARGVLSKDYPYPLKGMFLNYEPHDSRGLRFDDGFRPFTLAELWMVDRMLATMKMVSMDVLGHDLPKSVWNTPGHLHSSVDWDAIKMGYDYWGLDWQFINQYRQHNTPIKNIDSITDSARAFKQTGRRLVATLTPRDLGTPDKFSENDEIALASKIYSLRQNGVDSIYYWMNAGYIGNADGEFDQKNFTTTMGHINAFGNQLDTYK